MILAGGTAVITGAANGIGAAIATAAAGFGMNLVLADIDAEALDRTAERLAAVAPSVLAVPTDVTDPDAVDSLRSRALAQHGSVELLVNNAGIETIGQLWDMPPDEWDRVMRVNINGVFHGLRSFVPAMGATPTPSFLVNMCSVAAVTSGTFNAAYLASKHAVLSMTESLYLECRQRFPQISVSVACPAAVRTDIFEQAGSAGAGTESARQTLAEMRRHLREDGISADAAAQAILQGAVRGDFWIPTHPDRFATLAGVRAGRLAGLLPPDSP